MDMAICVFFLLVMSAWIPGIYLLHTIPGYEDEKACYGTSTGFAINGDSNSRYQKYKDAYTNCTYVVGNLEIVFLEEPNNNYDMSFLSSIKEVSGYVLLASNFVDYIPLTSLQIIRGNTLYHHTKTNQYYSLFVALNSQPGTTKGLRELRFTNLSEIMNGQVLFQDNNVLCFEESVNWTDINPHSRPPVRFIYDSKDQKRSCGECHESCYNPITNNTHCWGEGPNMCQKLSYGAVCHDNCGVNRCYGAKPNQCCHQECAGGCTGPKQTDCFACRSFKDEANCVSFCPKETIYDRTNYINRPNPDVKYTFGSLCVKACPGFLLQDGSSCVRQCAEGRHSDDQRFCKPCSGPCPKKCKGFDPPQFLNLQNISEFEGCTSIEGNMRILSSSFSRDEHYGIDALHPHNLTVLKHVKEITGFLLIQSNHSEFTDLSFLSSLKIIHGRTTADSSGNALSIMSTPLRSLELTSLKTISNGNVIIMNNNKLCYVDSIDWKQILKGPDQKYDIYNNRAKPECERDNLVCETQCGTSGCWGKGPNKCFQCADFFYEEKSLCLTECSSEPRLFHSGNKTCTRCHDECENSCTGPANTDCGKCKNVIKRHKIGKDSCEGNCGSDMYADNNKVCQSCHPGCGIHGCTGPGRNVGDGGCNGCDLGMKATPTGPIKCIKPTHNQSCEEGFFPTYQSTVHKNATFKVCEACHEYCTACIDPTPRFCSKCRYLRKDEYCVKECPSFEYAVKDAQLCEKCHSECRTGCFGPTSADCVACANFKIYIDVANKTFNCTSQCPHHLPFTVKEIDSDENRVVCADSSHPDVHAKNAEEERQKLVIILAVTVPSAFTLVCVGICITYMCHKRAQNDRKAAEYTAKIAGVEEIEPMTPTNAKPDLAKMRIVSEAELRKGNIIGSGAFGTVYKGIWIPHGENVKIPVAIKVLQEETSPGQATELLEEARVMCSVDNINCVRILAVCMKSQIMLVTQLMPHGNLLKYVRTNAQHIGSKALLNWCTQIARGMAYLEERGIVHRDLAARNVLVQTPNQVKITDFGLAKLLDLDAAEYHSQGGLMPIKWLALECILHRIFTHKSDVWSFGITIWELFTLGKKPYDSVLTKDVPILLEKGERLQQPIICTIDVYMIMVKCWMLDAESRPSFKDLQEEFAKMSRDPGRYLVIEGDSLMRLPSVSYDKHDLIHEISGGGPESVMDAEEYLNPVDQQNRPASIIRSYDRQHSNLSGASRQMSGDHSVFTDGAKGGSLGRDSLKMREKKHGHLTNAAWAKMERDLSNQNGDSVSSRYSSDPIKILREKGESEWMSNDSENDKPLKPLSPNFMKIPANIVLPVDEEDYLRPGAAAQSLAYLDLDGKGYYQNEKDNVVNVGDTYSNDMDPTFDHVIYSPHGDKGLQNIRLPDIKPIAVANPDYFEEEEDGDVWEHKKPLLNGYHQNSSPVHLNNKDNSIPQFRNKNGANASTPNSSQKVNTKVTLSGHRLDSSESKV